MAAYNIPRDTRGEGRILYIFSTKALMYTFIGAAIGLLPYLILNAIGLGFIGMIIIAILAFIGFAIATFKVPKIRGLEFTKNASGEYIDEIIKRVISFKRKKYTKYALYTKEEENGQ